MEGTKPRKRGPTLARADPRSPPSVTVRKGSFPLEKRKKTTQLAERGGIRTPDGPKGPYRFSSPVQPTEMTGSRGPCGMAQPVVLATPWDPAPIRPQRRVSRRNLPSPVLRRTARDGHQAGKAPARCATVWLRGGSDGLHVAGSWLVRSETASVATSVWKGDSATNPLQMVRSCVPSRAPRSRPVLIGREMAGPGFEPGKA